jgi:hypothetical protein
MFLPEHGGSSQRKRPVMLHVRWQKKTKACVTVNYYPFYGRRLDIVWDFIASFISTLYISADTIFGV